MKKELVKVIGQAAINIESLEDLKTELKTVETPQLVDGYLIVKDFANKVKSFTEAVREELLFDTPESAQAKEFDGRFFLEADVVDEKGHRYLNGESERQLKAEKRVSPKFNVKRAEEILKDRQLYDTATDKEVVGVDVTVLDKIVKLQEDLAVMGMNDFADRVEDLLGSFEIKKTLNEEKIEALVALETILPEEVELMYDVDITYALKEQKKRK